MHIHSFKHNAKSAAKRFAARFSGVEVVEPVKAVRKIGAATDGWYASLRIKEGVLPSSIAPEVVEAAHIELPAGWVIVDGGFVARAETPAENPYLEDTAQRFAALNPDGLQDMITTPAGDRMPRPAIGSPLANIIETITELDAADKALDVALAAVKPGGKEAQVFGLIRRLEGASASEIGAALNWQLHTTRAYVSVHSRKYGLEVVTEKVEGRGTVYRVRVPAKSETAA